MSVSSDLDKGLEEIIASTGISSGGRRQARSGQGFKKSRKGSNTKSLGKAIEAAASARANVKAKQQRAKASGKNKNSAEPVTPLPAGLIADPFAAAKRAVVSNLPLDVNEEAVRSYFSTSVGKIRKVEGSFRGDGTPSGTYTITFDRPGLARKLFEKFNNQPIDGGKNHLSVQILVDPNAVQGRQNSLQGRIGTPTADQSQKKAGKKNRRGPRRAAAVKADKGPLRAVAQEASEQGKGKGSNAKAKKPQKKKITQSDLDDEMTDYFANAEKSEISV